MAEITLAVEPRAQKGSAVSRRLRTEGRIPAVVYGHGVEPTSIAVDARELRIALSTEAGLNALFDLEVGGKHHLAIARALQRHPVRQTISHVDFQVVSRDEVVPADVPLVFTGEPTLVNRGDGSVEHLVQVIHIKAKPADIPVSFELDISQLEIGSQIHVSDLVLGKGVQIEMDPETTLVIAHPPRGGEASEETTEGEASADSAGKDAGADSAAS